MAVPWRISKRHVGVFQCLVVQTSLQVRVCTKHCKHMPTKTPLKPPRLKQEGTPFCEPALQSHRHKPSQLIFLDPHRTWNHLQCSPIPARVGCGFFGFCNPVSIICTHPISAQFPHRAAEGRKVHLVHILSRRLHSLTQAASQNLDGIEHLTHGQKACCIQDVRFGGAFSARLFAVLSQVCQNVFDLLFGFFVPLELQEYHAPVPANDKVLRTRICLFRVQEIAGLVFFLLKCFFRLPCYWYALVHGLSNRLPSVRVSFLSTYPF
mmetsp:Transcript_10333/g.63201  ORF Transcript_10333/g.63201 Transcript_10333/m.63201 type:complete len:265 (-) Transcript_10333:118-912(-)